MDDPLADGARIAHFDQVRAEAADWASALVDLRNGLRRGGFSSEQSYRLTSLWFDQQLGLDLVEPWFGAFGED